MNRSTDVPEMQEHLCGRIWWKQGQRGGDQLWQYSQGRRFLQESHNEMFVSGVQHASSSLGRLILLWRAVSGGCSLTPLSSRWLPSVFVVPGMEAGPSTCWGSVRPLHYILSSCGGLPLFSPKTRSFDRVQLTQLAGSCDFITIKTDFQVTTEILARVLTMVSVFLVVSLWWKDV